MIKNRDIMYIRHILDSINDIEESTKDISKTEFISTKDIKDANIRRIEIIGEAVKNISNNIKEQHKEIEWNLISGARDKITHHYFGVNLDIVCDILNIDIPKLKKQILIIKKELEAMPM